MPSRSSSFSIGCSRIALAESGSATTTARSTAGSAKSASPAQSTAPGMSTTA